MVAQTQTVIACGNCKRPIMRNEAIYCGEIMRHVCPCCRMKMIPARPFVGRAEQTNAYGR